ncbi:MAG: NERD domain-containing protein kinase family protein [Desulforegulaceae bacterium]|nr:NERD domain-containing protein kinase family protein [Desulforegulaceae bacterium]
MSLLKSLCDQIIENIKKINVNKKGPDISPHKYFFLLTLVELYNIKNNRDNKFYLNKELEDFFVKIWLKFMPETSVDKIVIEYPFFYLKNSNIWSFKINEGKEIKYKNYSKSGKRLTKKKLLETVKFAYLEDIVHKGFSDDFCRVRIKNYLEKKIKEISSSDFLYDANKQFLNSSLFPHEQKALDKIELIIKPKNLGYVSTNINIYNYHSNRYFEIDLLIVAPYGLYVVELKHWKGKVEIKPYDWVFNGGYRKDVHQPNSFKAKLIKGECEKKFPYLNLPFVESVVVFTHDECEIEGASDPKTTKSQPSFRNIKDFISYLENQSEINGNIIEKAQAKKICDYINSLNEPKKPESIKFNGLKIVEKIYQDENYEELIAKRENSKNLRKLRVIYDKSRFRDPERTLKTVEEIGDHPNILKVTDIPNDYGYLIESSDWSNQGDLQSYIEKKTPIKTNKALKITYGILSGLKAVHDKGVVHRNLSPDNILIINDDIPKLMNFDLSYQIASSEFTVIPEPSKLKKSPFIAPEIYEGESAESSDFFSVGVILYYMLTKEYPFNSYKDLKLNNGNLSDSCIKKINSLNLAKEIKNLLLKLLKYDFNKRPQTVDEIIEILENYKNKTISFENKLLKPDENHDLYCIVENLKKEKGEAQLYKSKGALGEDYLLKIFNFDTDLKKIQSEKDFSTYVTHNTLVKCENFFKWSDKRPVLAFKWIEGSNLREIMKFGLPELDFFKKTAFSLISGIEALHTYEEFEILHNDIKPENIIITNDKRPKIIDFGISSRNKIDIYSGTEGYIAPDLVIDSQREYCVSGDLFALGVTLFEWFFGIKPYKNFVVGEKIADIDFIIPNLNPKLKIWFLKSVDTKAENRFLSCFEMKNELTSCFSKNEIQVNKVEQHTNDTNIIAKETNNINLEKIKTDDFEDKSPNPFVAYLNTLNNINSNSSNMLAESQACNEYFKYIHVEHDLKAIIKKELFENKRHVILTGHAGDGKTTIALELFKDLRGIPLDEHLFEEMKRIEYIKDKNIKIIKDFSEWKAEDWVEILNSASDKNSPKMLLISNTGTLLNAFKFLNKEKNNDWLCYENKLLESFSKSEPYTFIHDNTEYCVINLAMYDNLPVAKKIFEKTINCPLWKKCEDCNDNKKCPVFKNYSLIKNSSLAVERIFYIYQRMFEYGYRFTLRQIVSHLSYIITSGMNYLDIVNYSSKNHVLISELLFFNRFFGDNGAKEDEKAQQIKVIKCLKNSDIGEEINSFWDRKLWVREDEIKFDSDFDKESIQFNYLRSIGKSNNKNELEPVFARKQIRRILYFFYHFPEYTKNKDENPFVSNFLKSPMLLSFLKWKKNRTLENIEKESLKNKILHVLQEFFTGNRLPEKKSFTGNLYITLSRQTRNIRQSSQIVLADFRAKDFDLAIENEKLFFRFSEKEDILLNLELPFLDYVMNRHYGDIGQTLDLGYNDRLESFKSQLISLKKNKNQKQLILLNLKTDHNFKEYKIHFNKEKLEVINNA